VRVLLATITSLLALLLSSCPVEGDGEHNAAGTADSGSAHGTQAAGDAATAGDGLTAEISGPGVEAAPEPWDPEVPGAGIVGQFIIIYSGDTLSIPLPHQDFEPPQGGLGALAGGITDYAAQIVDYNRMRIINEGGDPAGLKTDLVNGFLGEHPFVVVDYGGWERPNDPFGDLYVAPYLTMFKALKYTAVGCRLYEQLSPELWDSYIASATDTPALLASAGTPPGETLAVTDCIEREVRGETWKILSLPLPDLEFEDQPARLLSDWDSLAKGHGLDKAPSILLVSGAPGPFYTELAADPRASVVIGAPQSKSVMEGYGEIEPGEPLLLPVIDPGGRSVGVCHLYYYDDGDNRPDMYFLTKWICVDDLARPLPFRNQVANAVQQHRIAVAESIDSE